MFAISVPITKPQVLYPPLRLFKLYQKIASEVTEPSVLDSNWDWTSTRGELEAIDAICSSDTSISSSSPSAPTKKRQLEDCADGHHDSTVSPPQTGRRLADYLFNYRKGLHTPSSFTPCSRSRFFHSRIDAAYESPYEEMNFDGRIVYSRTVGEVEKAAAELLHLVEAKKSKDGECILGLDIEWRPSFTRGVSPGKAAVIQICGDNDHCHVMHIIHSGIPKNLQMLLEDPTSLKVGIGIVGDATKVFKDHNVSIEGSKDLSDIANLKLGGDPKRWSLGNLIERLMCRQLPKPNYIRLGNWEVKVLSKEQLKYAAIDAYASWYLYQALKSFPNPYENHRSSMTFEVSEICAKVTST